MKKGWIIALVANGCATLLFGAAAMYFNERSDYGVQALENLGWFVACLVGSLLALTAFLLLLLMLLIARARRK